MDEAEKPWNWWKIAFFVSLLAFELTRELLVVAWGPSARPNASAMVYGGPEYASAEGTWSRIDGGGRLVPGVVRIECRADRAECIEATTMILDDSVMAPDLNWFPATFTPGAVSYENDNPNCARYSVRLDLKLGKAFAVRDRRDNPNNPNCAKLERRIEMQLVNGLDASRTNALEGHFVPILKLIAAVFG